ncbi:endolytic transglycosylase MltG [Candidatus Bandiella euplotis]|uniref:Endolytic murein transglycosylase n=1 Tax=Candidatus Bandiella euplotis TaxID=1664265 RepID=A0ABZ0UN49_9RICK|nr:endolytic transglycosylase MltG [Candidatus Bandiella woodruffii]WPX97132.1 Putative MltG-like endolytic transglycosylase [Candidatus Bandiella woodruffii]
MIKKIFLYLIVLKLITIGLTSSYLYFNLYSIKTEKEHNIIIPKPCSIKCVADILSKNGVIQNKLFFIMYALTLKIFGKQVIAGEYLIPRESNNYQILTKITSGQIVIHQVTVPEGITINQVVALLKRQNGMVDDIKDLITYKEGELFSSTYKYLYDTNISFMLDKMNKEMQAIVMAEWENRDILHTQELKEPFQALILASIVEKESRFIDEKPLIAGVYLNRLKKNMALQADPTVIYGISQGGEFNRKVTYEDLKVKSPYNTYLHTGLPPTPICLPGKSSIIAVLHPQKTNFMYFVADSQGRHRFASGYKQHLQNIAEVRRDKSK